MSTLVRKTLITVSAGGGTFLLIGVLSDSGGKWRWTMSVLVAVTALVVQYLVDFGDRFEKFDRRFNEILAATTLFSQVDGSVLRSDEVTRLVLGYTKVRDRSGDIVQAFAEKELSRLARTMEGLGSGTVDCPGENHEWLIDITDCVKTTLDATSTSVDREFWSSGPAERYLAAQEKAIRRRGVDIRRLFVVRDPEEVTPDLTALCESHRRRGIEARIAVCSLLPSNPQVNDFIIFDGELCYEIQPDLESAPDGTRLRADPKYVEDRISQFADLWAASERT